MLSLNIKHVQYVKIYLLWNFSVNLITHFGVIALFPSNERAITPRWVIRFTLKLQVGRF
jgi:hypothetical protein